MYKIIAYLFHENSEFINNKCGIISLCGGHFKSSEYVVAYRATVIANEFTVLSLPKTNQS